MTLGKIIKLVMVLLIFGQHKAIASDKNLSEIVQYFNEKFRFELNLMVDLNTSDNIEYNELLLKLDIPKIVISKEKLSLLRDLYKLFNMQVLTVARVDATNFNATLNLLDGLLWRRHFTHIFFIWECQVDFSVDLLHSFFGECWKKGFTKVMVWCNNTTYTYSLYPTIQVREIARIYDYEKISHWKNLHQHEILIPIVQFPPRCFSYRNRHGILVNTGYYYKLIETFVLHYNGSLRHHFFDMWSNVTKENVENEIRANGYSFIASRLIKIDACANSDSISFASSHLIVPSGAEIDQSLYLVISFESRLWLLVLLIFAAFVLLISLIKQRNSEVRDIAGSIIESLKVIIFISIGDFNRRTALNFSLHLMFLLTGFFVTNLYSGNLCSMYTSRIYAPDLMTVEDIGKTKLQIFTYSADLEVLRNIENLPAIFFERLSYFNNTQLHINRQKLNMIYLYYAYDDVLNFLLFQQRFLKRPFARALPETLMQDDYSVSIPHRSPLIERFNWYLGRIKDSGILLKFVSDTQWDGVLSGVVQFFRNDEINRALSMTFFQYAVIVWSIGLLAALVCFINELIQKLKAKTVQIV